LIVVAGKLSRRCQLDRQSQMPEQIWYDKVDSGMMGENP